jgi:hypothetical protein
MNVLDSRCSVLTSKFGTCSRYFQVERQIPNLSTRYILNLIYYNIYYTLYILYDYKRLQTLKTYTLIGLQVQIGIRFISLCIPIYQ